MHISISFIIGLSTAYTSISSLHTLNSAGTKEGCPTPQMLAQRLASGNERHTSQAAMTMMRTLFLLVAFSSVVTKTTACITVHAYMQNCIISGDIVTAQAFDNGVEVCSGGDSKTGASSDTVFDIPCNDGYSLTITSNTKSATITSPNGYTATMQPTDTQGPNTFTCANVGDDSEINGTEYESCFSDGFSNCGDYEACSLCDYRSSCT